MLINFDKIQQEEKPHFRDGEGSFFIRAFDHNENKIMRGCLRPGSSIGMHTHQGNCEMIYILSGSGKAVEKDGETPVNPGECHYCPQGEAHSLVNNGSEDLEFFAVVAKQ